MLTELMILHLDLYYIYFIINIRRIVTHNFEKDYCYFIMFFNCYIHITIDKMVFQNLFYNFDSYL